MSKYSDLMDQAFVVLKKELHQIVENFDDNDPETQRKILRVMLTTFVEISKEKNMPVVAEAMIAFIKEDYPHMKEELDKILVLL